MVEERVIGASIDTLMRARLKARLLADGTRADSYRLGQKK